MPKKNCSVYPVCSTGAATNPNPVNFEVVRVEQVGPHAVAAIRYPDCKNYEGLKVCLFLDTIACTLRGQRSLDPHFDETDRSPFARFKPTYDGWKAAVFLAGAINR